MNRKIDPATMKDIMELFASGESSAALAEAYGVSRSYISSYASKHGIRSGHPRRRKTERKCEKCGNVLPMTKINLKMRFCPYCGESLLSPADLLIERLGRLFDMSKFVPDAMRETYVNVLRDTIGYIEKEVQNE